MKQGNQLQGGHTYDKTINNFSDAINRENTVFGFNASTPALGRVEQYSADELNNVCDWLTMPSV